MGSRPLAALTAVRAALPGSSTAHFMRDYVVAHGAPSGRISLEPASRTTLENLRLSFLMAARLGAREHAGADIIIVTDATHLSRSWLLAAYLGRYRVGLAAADARPVLSRYMRRFTILREAGAWWYNTLKILVWETLTMAGLPDDLKTRLIN